MTGRGVSRRLVRDVPAAVLFATGGGILGIVLAAVGHRAGPVAVVALPVAAALPFAILHHPSIAAFAIAASWPLGLESVTLGPLRLELVELTVLAVVPPVVIHRLLHGQALLAWSPPLWGALAWVLAAIAATADAVVPVAALRELLLLTAGVVISTIVMSVCDSFTAIRSVLVAVALAGLIVAIDAMTSMSELRSSLGGLSVAGRPEGIFTSPNQLGAATLLVGLPSAGLAMASRTRIQRVAGVAAASACAVALVLSLSRGAWFGALVGVMVLLVSARRARATVVRAVPLAAVLGVVLLASGVVGTTELAIVQQRAETFGLAAQGGDAYGGRLAIWSEALRQFNDEPVTGQGPGSFVTVSRRATSLASTVGALHAHNTLLDVAAEYGALGVGAFVAFVIAIAATAARTLDRSPSEEIRTLSAAVTAALAGIGAHSLVDHTLGNVLIATTLWFIVGLLLALHRLVNETIDQP